MHSTPQKAHGTVGFFFFAAGWCRGGLGGGADLRWSCGGMAAMAPGPAACAGGGAGGASRARHAFGAGCCRGADALCPGGLRWYCFAGGWRTPANPGGGAVAGLFAHG